ncbi:MAG: class I SAM-dependent DNA methyltransferase [Sphingobacteriales bacterium]|nr:MAG: class I SAM-dependent DNA methyltransferase [Sphingobacteriales bacterium]TAF82210.1 MAG: class I SAM-dependent DNA methyltransferase [Sphingobacteriales bacterium]
MALSWNEIKDRALNFSKEWANTSNEEADAKPFLVEFFNVFGINSKRVSTFEHRVKKLDDKDGYIDLLWKGTILIEMKSRGKNLDKAYQQAKDYTYGLKQHELPKYILVCDFENFILYDLEDLSAGQAGDKTVAFKLNDLYKNVNQFGQLLGYPKKIYAAQDPANIKAAELMGKLHDRLEEIGYKGHPLEVYLVRILFLLFAEDTTIFNKQQFQEYVEQRTTENGSDLAAKLQEVFQVLNTPKEKRFKNLDEQLIDFPYVNGKLFEEILPTASFDAKMRQALLDCCYMDWSKISPAIFGSMFQSAMNPKERRNLGAHYTSETNILKLIKPIFLDELWAEFEKVNNDPKKLTHFHNKISSLRFLDPACGCGNFLIITYREIRLLELQVLKTLNKLNKRIHQMEFIDISLFFKVNVDKFYGIEYEEFPARIAEVAMWLIDHQMNLHCSIETGEKLFRIPLVKSAKIVHGDALKTNWNSLLTEENTIKINAYDAEIIVSSMVQEPIVKYGKVNLLVDHYQIVDEFSETKPDTNFDYILGNPPFIGSKIMAQSQRNSVVKEFDNIQGAGILDYVTAWYIKAAKYIQNTKIKVAFVSTNSIVQGEQTSILWGQMLNKYKIKIHFAHRTFKWSNEAKGNAAVFCIIIGFANFDTPNKIIFDYENIKGEAHEIKAKNINPYLVDAKDILIVKKSNPICNVPQIFKGNQPTEGGYLILTEEEKIEYLKNEPKGEKFIKNLVSGKEFLNGQNRYCFWIIDSFNELKQLPLLQDRIKNVAKMRLESTFEDTRKLAERPFQFRDLKNPKSFIVIPATTSENRKYIPFAFLNQDYIPSNSVYIISDANLYHFGILMSYMHMAWVKTVCGRLKSDYRYSKDIVYNNYPWPENPNEKQVKAIETAAQKVLDTRIEYKSYTLAELYKHNAMPPVLVKAHNELDKAVDLAYRPQAFTSEANRMVFLFELYEKYTANLFTKYKPNKTKKTIATKIAST